MPSDVRFAEIQRLLEGYGYRLKRISGSHHIFDKPGSRPITIPVHHGKVKYVYVRHKSVKNAKALDRPFEPRYLKEAKEIVDRYQVVLQMEDGEYFGRCLELPMVMGDGKTADACVKQVREALIATVAYMLEEGQKLPVPASDQTRSTQVNIRLTASEKNSLEQAAHRKGFRGISDYVRHAALASGD